MATFFVLCILSILTACSSIKDKSFHLYFYQDSTVLEIDRTPEIAGIIDELIRESTESLKLLVTADRIEAIKANESCIELILDQPVRVRSKGLGGFKIDRLLIPLSGDYVGTTESPDVTIFLGDGAYMSGPLRNPQGLPKLQILRSLITGKK